MESVWDYPRPPALEPSTERVRVEHDGETIANSERALRVLETSQAPAYYIPPEDVRADLLEAHDQRTFCEWKGQASYWTVNGSPAAAWSYPEPMERYAALRDSGGLSPPTSGFAGSPPSYSLKAAGSRARSAGPSRGLRTRPAGRPHGRARMG